jgi:hypothetical protein
MEGIMKYLETFGVAALAALAATAFVCAGTASATELYSGATTMKTGAILKLSLSGSTLTTTTEGTVYATCTGGELEGKTTNSGSATETVKLNIESTLFTNCTEPTSAIRLGGLEIHWTSGLNGTVTAANSSGGSFSEVTVNTTIFGSCVFAVPSGGPLGTLTGTTSGDATLDLNAVVTRVTGLCPSTTKWVGTYKVTSVASAGGSALTPLHVTAS